MRGTAGMGVLALPNPILKRGFAEVFKLKLLVRFDLNPS